MTIPQYNSNNSQMNFVRKKQRNNLDELNDKPRKAEEKSMI